MAIPGKAVVRPGGKRGLLQGGKAAVFTVDGLCQECCSPFSSMRWEFTDSGMIDGGQDGAFRAYNYPSQVAASPWQLSVSPTAIELFLFWEDDLNCKNHNPYIQFATAKCTFHTWDDALLTIDWDGQAELEDPNYEWMYLYVDNTQKAVAHAPGGGAGCAGMGPIVSNPSPPIQIPLGPESHAIFMDCTTNDEQYHFKGSAYYRWEIRVEAL